MTWAPEMAMGHYRITAGPTNARPSRHRSTSRHVRLVASPLLAKGGIAAARTEVRLTVSRMRERSCLLRASPLSTLGPRSSTRGAAARRERVAEGRAHIQDRAAFAAGGEEP